MRNNRFLFVLLILLQAAVQTASAQNPLIRDQFTADPTARVFEGKVYVYPSHDVFCGTKWFCMKDYHVFSSANLTDWTDHGVIVSQEKVAWVDSTRNSMWAPDCMEKDGKYYFYFPAMANPGTGMRGMAVGVAVSDTPYGPFTPEPEPITGVSGIDPNIFIDKDGQAYMYWASRRRLVGARLKDNMLELASKPQPIESLPKGMKEGPFLFERNGIYYFTFPHVIEKTEALVYGMGDNPMGPFEYKGIIMDEHPSGCWTNHHSMVEYKGQWYIFYHHNDLSPKFDKNRSVCADSLFFNEDGTIQKVIPTLRGVGLTQAEDEIQIDRYSAVSDSGAAVAFLDTTESFGGWKIVLNLPDAWVRYNAVDFKKHPGTVRIKAMSGTGARLMIQIGRDNSMSPVEVEIPVSEDWQIVKADLGGKPDGVQNISVLLKGSGDAEIDWIQFE